MRKNDFEPDEGQEGEATETGSEAPEWGEDDWDDAYEEDDEGWEEDEWDALYGELE